jgi:hypothetical protein
MMLCFSGALSGAGIEGAATWKTKIDYSTYPIENAKELCARTLEP